MTDTKRRIVERLKRLDDATVPELAPELGLTETAVRQHLEVLEDLGIVQRAEATPHGRGRPALRWSLTERANELFPDRHAELTAELIGAIRTALGEQALSKVLEARSAAQLAAYRSAIPARSSVKVRVRRLAELRTAEGYLAEVQEHGDELVLVEHHCPVCEAARTCAGLCRSELELFEQALGPGVEVSRVQHLLGGDHRCAYRVTAR